ncbi:hypothetical protein JCM1841_002445 [Sporobolomyces salmonicolor]
MDSHLNEQASTPSADAQAEPVAVASGPSPLPSAIAVPSLPPSQPPTQIKFTLRGRTPALQTPSPASTPSAAPAQDDSATPAQPEHLVANGADNGVSPAQDGPAPTNSGSSVVIEDSGTAGARLSHDGPAAALNGEGANGGGPGLAAMQDTPKPDAKGLPGSGFSFDAPTGPTKVTPGSSSTLELSPAPDSASQADIATDPVAADPVSSRTASEAPSRVGSPTPREATPALSEAASETASVDTSLATAPELSADSAPPAEKTLAHPLSAYQFSNTALVPIASTSTNPFHFVHLPPRVLEDSWFRTRLPDDAEAYVEIDREAGYHASPAELEASRARQAERQAKIQAKLAKLKGKGKETLSGRGSSKSRDSGRAGSADGVVPRRGRVPKSSLQQQYQAQPEIISPPKPIVKHTRFNRSLAMALIPDDLQTATPAHLAPHPAFIDLLALPAYYTTDDAPPPTVPLPAPAQAFTPSPAIPQASQDDNYSSPDPSLHVSENGGSWESNGAKRARPVEDDGSSVEPSAPAGSPVEWVVQSTTCLSKKIDGQVRCFQCIARSIGHGCCFLGIRSFGVDEQGKIVTPPVFRSTTLADDVPVFKNTWTSALTEQLSQLLRTWLAPHLLGVIERELAHASHPDTIRVRLDLAVHSLCDTCLTSNLGSEWMCTTCGRMACRICHAALVDIEKKEDAGEPSMMATVESQRRKKCIAKKRGEKAVAGEGHRSDQFVAMTRLDKVELEQLWKRLKDWRDTHAIIPSDPAAKDYLSSRYQFKSTLARYDENTHPVYTVPAHELNEPVFLELWRHGEPILVTQVPLGDLVKWTPRHFASTYGDIDIQMLNNKGTEFLPSTVGYFFGQFQEGDFKREDEHASSFRTKDFPNNKHFENEFRELKEEFYRVLPLPNITRPDGVLNVLAHTPTNALQPDLGPRATCSWSADALTGTTQLRTEVTDVASLMYWSAKELDTGGNKRIRWDIFRSEDADKLRDFCWEILSKKLPKGMTAARFRESHDDPLLSPCLYLDQRQRELLWEKKGVKSYPLYQYPGDLVLVPAGCPYQTASWCDHLNLTTSFLSGARIGEALKTNEACQYETKERTLWRQDNKTCEASDKTEEPAAAAAAPAAPTVST